LALLQQQKSEQKTEVIKTKETYERNKNLHLSKVRTEKPKQKLLAYQNMTPEHDPEEIKKFK
jgi:hypothetical protein